MLRKRDRLLLAAFACTLAGAVSGWVLLAVLPAKAAPLFAVRTSAPAYAAGEAAAAKPVITAIPAPAPRPAAAIPAPTATPRATKAPPSGDAAAADDPATGREFHLQLEDGTSASLDAENGRLRLRTRFGDFAFKL